MVLLFQVFYNSDVPFQSLFELLLELRLNLIPLKHILQLFLLIYQIVMLNIVLFLNLLGAVLVDVL